MYLLIAVSLFNVSTGRATLACISWINLNYSRLILFCLVNRLLFKVIETTYVLGCSSRVPLILGDLHPASNGFLVNQ